ncbi:MAG: hypothetical protein QM813_18490 [Verrucomicrobiota bacterium]
MKRLCVNQLAPSRQWMCVIVLAALACGCSSFNRQWKQAGQQPAPTDAITGRWEGRWFSDANAHTGKLRCIITHQTNDLYAARFRATYMKILRFSYTVPLTINASNAVWHFQGEENLGAMAGGVYRYVGSATPTNFHSTYDSKYDRGTFEMQRP